MTTLGRFQIALAVISSTLAFSVSAQTPSARTGTVIIDHAQLDSLLRIGRADTSAKWSAAEWRAAFSRQIDNPLELLLANADSLRLTEPQVDSIAHLNMLYLQRANAVWAPVAEYLAALPDQYDSEQAWSRVNDAVVNDLIALLHFDPSANAVLTTEQIDRVPAILPDPVLFTGMAPASAARVNGGPTG